MPDTIRIAQYFYVVTPDQPGVGASMLATLRDAAEADKQSLLRRLGRSEVVDTIVGEDTGLGQVMERVGLVSRSEVPVLILGETGTGKELVARAIHSRSDRRTGPRAGGPARGPVE